MSQAHEERTIEILLRDLAPEVLAVVGRRYRDFPACEDAVQEALITAHAKWPHEGIPNNPRGWLIQVALRRMTDFVRNQIARRNREHSVAKESPIVVAPQLYTEEESDPDDSLMLLFMCCHESLTTSSAIALTLRAMGGLTTSEIAKAFMIPEPTMAQRITRAKQTIQDSGKSFEMPDAEARVRRLDSVLHVLYLIFNEGYTASHGPELIRTDLSNEAIRLTRKLNQLLPGVPEVIGLLALMLLTDARRAARTSPQGELILLEDQDRSLWDQAQIAEGILLVEGALASRKPGPYQLQAAIAALHDEAATAEQTDWAQIVALYEVLLGFGDNPMVALNHAVAYAMLHGPQAGLQQLESIASKVTNLHRLDSVRGHLYERIGDLESAAKFFRSAAMLATNRAEQNYLFKAHSRVTREKA